MQTVKEFIEKIASDDFYGNDVKVFSDKEKNDFINEYLRKLESLAMRKNKEIDIDFLRENLNRNVKYIVDVTYTEEEKNLEEQSKSYCEKQNVGAMPGQYCQGRIVYSNMSNEILKDHETTHAARIEIFNKTGEHIVPVDYIDDLVFVKDTPSFLKQFPNTYSTNGYDKSEVDENGNYTGELDENKVLIGPPAPSDFDEMSDLIEICTESIAGMMNEPNEREFEKYSIPTSKMSAISFYRQTRDLLIMAIGSDDFIFDMLSRDTSKGLNKLNDTMKMYKDSASIVEYLRIAGEYAFCQGRIDNGIEKEFVEKRKKEYLEILNNGTDDNLPQIQQEYEKCKQASENGTEKQYVVQRRDEYLRKLENYVTDMFVTRMEIGLDKDKNEQMDYFYSRLETKEAKEKIQQIKESITPKISEETMKINKNKIAKKVFTGNEAITGKEYEQGFKVIQRDVEQEQEIEDEK